MIDKIVEISKASINKDDLRAMLRILTKLNPKNILEIGSHKGYSAEVWIRAFRPDKFVTIEKDPKPNDAVEYISDKHHYLWNTDSHNRNLKIDPGPYDFLFIDGDHSYEGVRNDWETFGALVRPGGIVMLHDSFYHANGTEEVDIFWRELKLMYPYQEIKSSSESTGVGVIFL